MLQKIFSQEVRFRREDGSEFPEWEARKIGDVLVQYNEKSPKDNHMEHLSLTKNGVSPKTTQFDRDFLVKDKNKEYKVTHLNDICYNPANLKFGVICRNKYGVGIFSPIYITFRIAKNYDPVFIEMMITRTDFINYALRYQEGTVYERKAVSPEALCNIKVYMPSLPEQEKIASFFKSIDKLIAATGDKLAKYQDLKKAMLQRMFA